MSGLQKYELPFDEGEDTDALRDRLAAFYAERTLTKQAILPEGPGRGGLSADERGACQDDGPDSERGWRVGGGVPALADRNEWLDPIATEKNTGLGVR